MIINIFDVKELENISGTAKVHYFCKCCGKECTFQARSSTGLLCKACKTNKTRTKREGPDWAKQHYKKQQQTLLKKYGVKNCSAIKGITEKKKASFEKHYGASYGFSKEVNEKREKTNLDKYGVKWVLASDEIKEKIKKQ